jgi:hypothetical protein
MIRLVNARMWLLVIGALALTPRDVAAQAMERAPLPDYLEASIPEAIDRGKYYLQRSQKDTGTWAAANEGNVVGYAALPALTLLELGTPANDPGIQRAANFVRLSVRSDKLTSTYEVALALLFLDKLDDKKDQQNIETLAGRIIAAQTPTGGWGYSTQYLNQKQTDEIIKYVRQLEPLPLHHLLAGRVANMNNPFVKREAVATSELNPKRKITVPREYAALPCFMQLGAYPLVDPDPNAKPPRPPFLSHTDNSTTQFALLALWAARRHKVPCTRTGALAFMRYHTGQNSDGSWGYEYKNGGAGASATMIAPGLLGLAIGHGIVKEMPKELKLQNDPPVDEDPRILHGFKALGVHVGMPLGRAKDVPYPNLYFLWGVERVCVLYGVELVGNKNWYHWGAEALVANQEADGSWFKKDNYPGAATVVDTSFALMFLKRANLAKDLSAYLAFSPKKLNDGVTKLMPPAPPPKEVAKAEPPKVVESKPEPKPEPPKQESAPVQVAEAKLPQTAPIMQPPVQMQPPVAAAAPPQQASRSEAGTPIWIWIVIGLGGVLVVGGILAFFLLSGGGDRRDARADKDYDDDEDDRPRRRKKARR